MMTSESNIKPSITGFILAGGKSSRMGQDKGLIQFRGKPMIQYSIDALSTVCDSIVIISSVPDYNRFGLTVIPDNIHNQGPLAGICTALSYSETKTNVILTCDSPFVNTALIEYLVNAMANHDVVVPFFKKRIYPLTAVYQQSSLPYLLSELNAGHLKVKTVLKELNLNQLEISEKLPFFSSQLLSNINSPEDLRQTF